jgi:glutaryl-CoA dehydrogenase (non-decarboxylating)
MTIEPTSEQLDARSSFRAFVDAAIAPHAADWDRDERTPPEILRRLADDGLLGACVPADYGGKGLDALTYGLLCAEIARGSASLLSLLTVHGMVCQALLRWGTDAQRRTWLPRLARGERVAAFGLTEPEVGSDAKDVRTRAERAPEGWRLDGEKTWISYAQAADLFLILARTDGGPTAFLVDAATEGLTVQPITGLLGFRAALLGRIALAGCQVDEDRLLGREGFGFSHVVGSALDHGRYCIAWGCLGIGEACLEASLDYAGERTQFGVALKGHQLIQRMVADMLVEIKATRMLCLNAAALKARGDPALIMETSIAKYHAARMVNQVAADAVQIHGANGIGDAYPVQRHLRDAKVMEIIEGSTQMQQLIIAKSAFMGVRRQRRAARRGDER